MGDVTRITCLGSNGWSAALNQGQAILANSRSIYWNGHAINRGWSSVTSSTNGSKLVAVDRGLFGGSGLIYTSIDGGTNWIARESNREWRSVASSADGNKLVAVESGGLIYTSTDSGATWSPSTSPSSSYVKRGSSRWRSPIEGSLAARAPHAGCLPKPRCPAQLHELQCAHAGFNDRPYSAR